MNQFLEGISLIFARRDSKLFFVVSAIIILCAAFALQNGSDALSVLSFSVLPLHTRLTLATNAFFNISDTFINGELVLLILGTLLSALNIALAYTYMKIRGSVILSSGLYSGFGLVLAFLGVGCAACGTALLSVVASIFGFSSLLGALPFHGIEIGYMGIAILMVATYTLGKKVALPLVC